MSPKEDTLFRVDYRRNTNYASAEAEQSTNTTAALGRRNVKTGVSRSGDLLSQVYLHARFDALLPADPQNPGCDNLNHSAWVNGLGYAMIEDIACNIGNKRFDSLDGHTMFMREQVAAKSDRKLDRAVGIYDNELERWYASLVPQDLYVPLQFWFNNFIEQSLPVIGLYWHEIELTTSLRAQADLIYTLGAPAQNATTNGMTEMDYVCNFQYLDRPERALFANQKLEQIFVQHQNLGTESWLSTTANSLTVNIRMNHPVIDLMWAPILDRVLHNNNADVVWNPYFNFDGMLYVPPASVALGIPGLIQTPYKSAQIFFNNQQRTVELTAEYLNQIPQHRSHDRIGSAAQAARVGGYSFAAKANDILHTGSANFSRFDQATVRFNLWTAGDEAGYTDGNTFWRNAATVRVDGRNWQLNKTSIGMMGIKFAA